jgi:hypothetical protein
LSEYAVAVRDEVWSHGVRIERRLAHGVAVRDGDAIAARDTADPFLVARVTDRMPVLRACIRELGDARARLVLEAIREDGREVESATITVAIEGISIVTRPESISEDVAHLRALLALPGGGSPPSDGVELVWMNGSASVLLHEAIGHATEHGHPDIDWPVWLRVEAPLSLRRATFRDVPLMRMTTLVAWQHNAPFSASGDPVEIHLLAGGAYEPLTELVTLHVAVATHRGTRLAPFTVTKTRRELASSLTGARGEPLRYPGVICSREGQELVVGSYAPVVVTR